MTFCSLNASVSLNLFVNLASVADFWKRPHRASIKRLLFHFDFQVLTGLKL